MRIILIALVAVLCICAVPAVAASDQAKLYNVGVSVSSEGDEQTTITLWLEGDTQPAKVENGGENILVYDLPGVELTAADEGVTSVAIFSPSVASIKLTQIGKEPFTTRLEIYTNGLRDITIEKVDAGYDFIVYTKGGTPILTGTPEEKPVEAPPVAPPTETPPAAPPVVAPPSEKPAEETPLVETAPVETTTETTEGAAVETTGETSTETAKQPEPPKEEVKEDGGINLLEGVNLLVPKEEAPKPAEPPKEEKPQPPAQPYVPPADFVKLESLNYQAGEGDDDLLVFTLADNYKGEVKTNFMYKKGFIVLTTCDVSSFVVPGEFKTVKLTGKHLKSVVVNINTTGEAVFSLILKKPDAKYELIYEVNENVVKVYIKPAK